MKIYRLEFEDGFGPHCQDNLKNYPQFHKFCTKANNKYKSLNEHTFDILSWIKKTHYNIDMYSLFCAFVDQNSLLEYVSEAFEVFLNEGGLILEIEIDSKYCFIAEDKQVFFIRDRVEQKRILL